MPKRVVLVVNGGTGAPGVRAALSGTGLECIETNLDAKPKALQRIEDGRVSLCAIQVAPAFNQQALSFVREIRRIDRQLPIFLIVENGSEEFAIAALRAEVTDYFKEPFAAAESAADLMRRLETAPPCAASSSGMIGESPAVRQIRNYISRIAPAGSNVLITGETGTGKEVAASLIHNSSSRAGRPFVCINCAAIPDALLESELFGHERGAFTGADSLQEGKLTGADGGTVFLDEVGDMTPSAQAKVLRAIETKEVQRLGGRAKIPLNIRIVAATNRDVDTLAGDGLFRSDLLFRLNVARIHLPPLRERREDIPILTEYYLAHFNQRFGRRIQGLTDDAVECLLNHDWPGNIRELKNVLEIAYAELSSESVSVLDLPAHFHDRLNMSRNAVHTERDQLLTALVKTNWNKTETARKLNWSRMTLYRKMVKYSLNSPKEGRTDRQAVTLSHS